MAGRRWVTVRAAWETALYGPDGFYRHQSPAGHFATSPHTSSLFAVAVAELARRLGRTSVVDLGAGSGRLLADLHATAPDLDLLGVDLRARPAGLPGPVRWQDEVPTGSEGLVIANELLDNVPCDVVELDATRRCRVVEVDAATGDQRLGEPAAPDLLDWATRWWPLRRCGERAEVGLARDAWWAGVCAANDQATCIAVDYGHLAGSRPREGSLASYRAGVQNPVMFDATRDVTAHVAFDSLAAAVGGAPRRQRDVLHELGISGRRPVAGRASTDPAGYLRDLARATQAAELTAVGGLGDFYWLVR